MGITNTLMEYIGLKIPESKEVYCQNCGKDLTSEGGDVSDTRMVYCSGLGCTIGAVMKGVEPQASPITNYLNTRQLQKAIKSKELIHFGPLEKELVHKN